MDNKTIKTLLDEFIEKCRHAGLSVTPQRLAIYKALLKDSSHPSPEKIYKRIKSDFPTISFATVYKTLETFEKNNIIARVTTLHNTVRYDPFMERHHHVICVKCKKVFDIQDARLDSLPIPTEISKENTLLDFSVHFNVICAECRGKE